jgi:putative flippase GtrA
LPATPDAAGIPIIGRWLPPSVRQLFWFGVVGGSGVVGFILVSWGLVSLHTGVPPEVISVLTYAAFIPLVYLGHRWLSFRFDASHRTAFPRYLATQVCALVVAAVISFVVYRMEGLPNLVRAILVSGLTSPFTCIVLKDWAFAIR